MEHDVETASLYKSLEKASEDQGDLQDALILTVLFYCEPTCLFNY